MKRIWILMGGVVALFFVGSGFDHASVLLGARDRSEIQDDGWRRSARPASSAAIPYIVIDRTNSLLTLRRGDDILLRAVCSTGSGNVLVAGERRWIFDTPQGRFSVLAKQRDPIWRKPDWAFLEVGIAVPENPTDRLEGGVLGEYALSFGDGYLIHGTLYERLIGYNVTHGCIRLGREPLRQLYEAVAVGTEVYIY